MKGRIFKQLAWMGALCAIYGHSQTCNSTILYDGSTQKIGKVESSSMTFPEYPEWAANWGNFDNMKAPYMRFSGQKNATSDWNAALVFSQMPVSVQGGTLKLKARATQNVKFGVWMSGDFGTSQMFTKDIAANQTASLEISVSDMIGKSSAQVEKVWISLQKVPTYQYTTLFVDDVEFSCTGSSTTTGTVSATGNATASGTATAGNTTATSAGNIGAYTFIKTALSASTPATSMLYSQAEQQQLQQRTQNLFVLTEEEHNQIQNFKAAKNLAPEDSREGWRTSLITVDRRRLKDSVIANPKKIFLDANNIAASYESKILPLLLADLDYDYELCKDTMCTETSLTGESLLLAGLPFAHIKGSRVKLAYDPYFVVTTRKSMPNVEICVNGKCTALQPRSEMLLEFESAGIQKITVKASSGSISTTQILTLEVK